MTPEQIKAFVYIRNTLPFDVWTPCSERQATLVKQLMDGGHLPDVSFSDDFKRIRKINIHGFSRLKKIHTL